MPKSTIKPYQRVLDYFKTASITEASIVLDLVKDEVKARQAKEAQAQAEASKPAPAAVDKTKPGPKPQAKAAPAPVAKKKPGPKPGSKRKAQVAQEPATEPEAPPQVPDLQEPDLFDPADQELSEADLVSAE